MYEIEQIYRHFYDELDHEWNEGEQTIDGETGEILSRKYSFLEFERDYRVALVDRPPEPEPYYEDGNSADRYYLVTQTVRNTVYSASKELEIDGEIVESAREFAQWQKRFARFDYQRIWIDTEASLVVWQPKPPSSVNQPADGKYQLFIDNVLVREALENSIVLTIPKNIWGIKKRAGTGVYLINYPSDGSTNHQVSTDTELLNHSYLKLTKSAASTQRFEISLRGNRHKSLPGELIPLGYSQPELIESTENKYLPPSVATNGDFPVIEGENPQDVTARDSLNWEVV